MNNMLNLLKEARRLRKIENAVYIRKNWKRMTAINAQGQGPDAHLVKRKKKNAK